MSINAPKSGAGVKLALVLGLLMCFQFSNSAQAQPEARFRSMEDLETNINSYYYLVEPGAASVQISAFGELQHPGVYVLEEGSNLAFLLALGGGVMSTSQPDVRQTVTVRLYRNSGSVRSLAYESSFDEVMDQAATSPTLSEGDIVTVDVERQRRLNWRDIFTVIGPILSTLLLVERLTSSN